VPELAVASDAPVGLAGDRLLFRRYVDPLVGIITDPRTETPFTIGVFGVWGSGKSSLLRMIEEQLESGHAARVVCVRFNPWVHRRETDMIVPLLHALRDRLDQDRGHRFAETVKELGTIILHLGTDQILRRLTMNAVNLEKIGTLSQQYAEAQGMVESRTRNLRAVLQGEADRLAGKNTRLVFLVDDLDRCEPDQIIDLLESVKLFLDLRNIVFVIAVAKEVVDRGIAVKYQPFGFTDAYQAVIGDEYLDKIIQLPLHLLPLAPAEIGAYVRAAEPAPYVRAHLPLLERIVLPNPRKIKRVLNLLAVTGAIIEATPGLDTLRPDLVARLVVLRVQSPGLYADVVRLPALLRALELTCQNVLALDTESGFRQRFGAQGAELHELTRRHHRSQDYLARLFADSRFDEVGPALPAYLTMISG
jgi:hypothetical protein